MTPPEPSTSPTLDKIFAHVKAVDSISDLAQDGIFEDDAELDEFLSYLRRMRNSDL